MDLSIVYQISYIVLAFFLALLFFPIVHEFILAQFLRLLRFTAVKYNDDTVFRLLNRIFFIGTLSKLFIRLTVVRLFSGDITSGIAITFDRVYVGLGVNLRQNFKAEVTFLFAPYVLIIVDLLLFIYQDNLILFLVYNGFNVYFSYFMLWYIIVSIFISGLPRSNELFGVFVLMGRDHPLTLMMLAGIIFSSIFFVPALGLENTSLLTLSQLVIFVVMELRNRKAMQVVSHPEEDPDTFLRYVELGVI